MANSSKRPQANDPKYVKRRKIGISLTAIVLAGVLFCSIFFPVMAATRNGGAGQQMSSTVSSTQSVADVYAEDKQALTIDKVRYPNLDDLILQKFSKYDRKFNDISLPTNKDLRLTKCGFSDGLSIPFESFKNGKPDFAGATEELRQEIINNPVVGFAYADFLARLTFPDGYTVGDCNDWLTKGLALYEERMQIPETESPCGNEFYLELRNNAIYTTDEYHQFACRVCLLLDNFISVRAETRQSSVRYMNGMDGMKADGKLVDNVSSLKKARGIRTTAADKQENKLAWVMQYKTKGDQVLFVIGANALDRSPESFADTPAPVVSTPKKTTTPKPTPKPGPSSSTPPPSSTPFVPTQPKDPTEDPYPQGNASIGGKPNVNSGAGASKVSTPHENDPTVSGYVSRPNNAHSGLNSDYYDPASQPDHNDYSQVEGGSTPWVSHHSKVSDPNDNASDDMGDKTQNGGFVLAD